jgi:hypothetical protein
MGAGAAGGLALRGCAGARLGAGEGGADACTQGLGRCLASGDGRRGRGELRRVRWWLGLAHAGRVMRGRGRAEVRARCEQRGCRAEEDASGCVDCRPGRL